MSELNKQALSPSQFALIDLFYINLEPIGVSIIYRFCNDIYKDGRVVKFKGNFYEPVPLEASGFSVGLTPPTARPRLKIGNLDSTMSLLSIRHQDFIGASLVRIRTYEHYLVDDPNVPEYPREVFIIERKLSENQEFLEFEAASPLDIENVQIPGQIITRKCRWRYRGAECGYTGNKYFDKFDNPVMFPHQDECSHTVDGCVKRFGKAELRYGGYPLADIN